MSIRRGWPWPSRLKDTAHRRDLPACLCLVSEIVANANDNSALRRVPTTAREDADALLETVAHANSDQGVRCAEYLGLLSHSADARRTCRASLVLQQRDSTPQSPVEIRDQILYQMYGVCLSRPKAAQHVSSYHNPPCTTTHP